MWMDGCHWGHHPCPHQDVGRLWPARSGLPLPCPIQTTLGMAVLSVQWGHVVQMSTADRVFIVHYGQMFFVFVHYGQNTVVSEYLLSYAFLSFGFCLCTFGFYASAFSLPFIPVVGVGTRLKRRIAGNTDLRLACLPPSLDPSCVSSWLIFKLSSVKVVFSYCLGFALYCK